MINKKIITFWLFGISLFAFLGAAGATNNFVIIHLPNDVSIELPRNWTAISNNQRITLDTWVQSKRELAGISDSSSDLNFAANYYDDSGKTAAIFNIRYYPDIDITQVDSLAASKSDIEELDGAIKDEIYTGMQKFGITVLSWLGTEKHSINGIVVFITEYRRASLRQGSPFRVRLVRVFDGEHSFTITISYREDQEFLLRPICDRVIQSLHM